MAEKEERITIHEVAYPCRKCSINCNKSDWKDCDFYQNYISGMTRTEAIERMAKAAYYNASTAPANFPDWDKMEDEIGKEVKQGFIRFAEAALNALLEEK